MSHILNIIAEVAMSIIIYLFLLNIAYFLQCLEQPKKLELCGLDPHRLNRPDRFQDNTKMNLVNVLKVNVLLVSTQCVL